MSDGSSLSNQPIASKKEVTSWYAVDVANSVYSLAGIGGFLPLLVQTVALAQAGFPRICPNVVTDPSMIAGIWGANSNITSMFRLQDRPDSAAGCTSGDGNLPSCLGQWCRGLPGNVNECRTSEGSGLFSLRLPSSSIDPTSFATTSITISVIAQALAFISIGAMADFGSMRKSMLLYASYVGALTSICCVFLVPSTWWLGLPIMVISNTAFGLTMMTYNAYLPLLVASLPDVRAESTPARRLALEQTRASELSSRGLAWGFAGGVGGLLLCVPWAFILDEIQAYQAALVITGLWWVAWMYLPSRHLHPRPGPPLPEGANYVSESWASTLRMIKRIRVLPLTSLFLLYWALYSDGVFAIGTLGALYANAEVEWGCLSKEIGILLMLFFVPLFAWGGNVTYLRLQQRYGWSPKSLLITSLAASGIIPFYGMIGFISKEYGLRQGWEALIMSMWYGFHLGPMQAYARSLLASLIPPGQEGTYFAAFELSNKGSSWICPLVMTIIQQATGDLRPSFVFVLVSIWVPAYLLHKLDLDAGMRAAKGRGEGTLVDPSSGDGQEGAVVDIKAKDTTSLLTDTSGLEVNDLPLVVPGSGTPPP